MAKGTPPRRQARKPQPATIDGEAKRTGRTENAAGASGPRAEHVDPVELKLPQGGAASSSAASAAGATGKSAARPVVGAQGEAKSSASAATQSPNAGRATPRPQHRSGASLMAAALGGGIVAVIGMTLLQWMAILPGQNTQDFVREEQFLAMSQEVDALRQAVSGMEEAQAGAPPQSASDGELADLSERIGAVEAALGETGGDDGAEAANMAVLDELRAEIADIREAQDGAVADLGARLEQVEAELAEPGAEADVARAFAAANLKSAIDRGGSFRSELDAYATFAPEDAAVETLGTFAENGVPTRQALVQRFPDVASEILAATRGEAGRGGAIDRLMNSAMSLVTIRPTGEVAGETPEAIVARIEARLNEGDFDAALAEWETLPQAGRDVSAEFAADLRGRAEADGILDQSLAAASGAAAQGTN